MENVYSVWYNYWGTWNLYHPGKPKLNFNDALERFNTVSNTYKCAVELRQNDIVIKSKK